MEATTQEVQEIWNGDFINIKMERVQFIQKHINPTDNIFQAQKILTPPPPPHPLKPIKKNKIKK